jgi:hypothetical protein
VTFNEETLRAEVEAIWGPAGAHAEVLAMLIRDAARWRAIDAMRKEKP